jgi:MtrB/PioB family decaheme-associated outer membrane protein
MTIARDARLAFPVPLLLILAAAPAGAEETQPAEAEVVFGPQYYASEDQNDAAKFGEYRDVPNGFVAERLVFSWEPRPRLFFDVDAYDLTQRDQRIGVEFGKVDVWKGAIRWVENPRLWTDRALQLWAHQGGGVFTLEDSFQSAVEAASGAAPTDADMDGLWDPGTKAAIIQRAAIDGVQPVFVGHQRRVGGVGFEFTPTRNWTFTLDTARERRDGTAPQTLGMTFAFAPAEVAAPYDYRTDRATGTVEYSHRRFNVGAQVTASTFETGYDTLIWDNQLILNDTGGPTSASPGRMRLTLGTDNDLTRVSLFGGVRLPGKTRVDATFARTETTQDDAFLPMTINSILTPSALPADSLDGEHRTTIGHIRVHSRPTRQVRWGAWVKAFELDNRSMSLTFDDYVTTDASIPFCSNANACGDTANTIARRNLPVGFEKTTTGAMIGWSPTRWFDGSLTFERENQKREFAAVEDSDEDIWKLTLDFDVTQRVSIRTTLRHQEREAEEYDAHYWEESFPIGESVIAAFNEGTRRFHWTDRERDAAALLVDWTLHDKVSIYVEASYADNDYTDPATGLSIGDSFTVMEDRDFDTVDETYVIRLAGRTRDRMRSYALGIAVAPTARFNFYADYGFDEWEYGLETRYRNVSGGIGTDDPLDDWGSDVEDDYATANLGFDLDLTKDRKWRLRLDASRSEGTGNIETHFVPGGAASGNTTLTEFPELRTVLSLATLSLTHAVRPNLDYTLRYWYESWKEDNFASDFNATYMGGPDGDPGATRMVFLGLDFRDYTNHIVSFLLRYRFR